MQQNRDKTAVTHMEPDEIRLYDLYAACGLPRGDLPYSEQFNSIFVAYNPAMNNDQGKRFLWRMLERVCKNGEEKIDAYLRRVRAGAAVPAAVAV